MKVYKIKPFTYKFLTARRTYWLLLSTYYSFFHFKTFEETDI